MLYTMSVQTPTLFREETLHVVHRGCEDTLFREETLHVVHHGCGDTHTSKRENLTCCTSWVWRHPHYLDRKPYMLYIMGVTSCTLFSEETMHAVHCGCEDTHTIQRGNLTCCTPWVWSCLYLLKRRCHLFAHWTSWVRLQLFCFETSMGAGTSTL